MHLHGFYFTLDGLGDGLRDTAFEPAHRRRMVTQLMGPGATMAMTWRAEREGKWVFHCHISEHISPERRIAPPPDAGHAHGGHDAATGAATGAAGMSGLILGVTIVKDQPGDVAEPAAGPPRAMTLTMRTEAREGARPVYGFALSKTGEADPGAPLSVPGPMLVLERGRPVEIALVNRLPEATAIHWHGMELESYYDGVHGWSGVGSRVTPLIAPGSTFVVRFTPPRTGTFIYHTHLHDDRQLTSGMYGGMVVVEPGETFDPDLDHVVVIGRSGPERNAPALLNGSREPLLVWKAGARHRVRFVNITPRGHLRGVADERGDADRVAPGHQGRRAAARCRPGRRSRHADHCRRRDLRLRDRRSAGPPRALAQRPHARRPLDRAGPHRHQVGRAAGVRLAARQPRSGRRATKTSY